MIAGIPPAAIVFYDHQADRYPTEPQFLPWEASSEEDASIIGLFFERDFTECMPCPGGKLCAKKNGLAFSPGIPRPGTTRADINTEFLSLLVFDKDHASAAEMTALQNRLSGLELVVSSTHSHQRGGLDDNCVRIALPLLRPLSPNEFRTIYREVNQRFTIGADPSTKDLSRLYFTPSSPIGGPSPVEVHQRGALLDLDDLLKSASAEASIPPPRPSGPSSSMPALNGAPVDMAELRDALRKYNKRDDDGVPTKKQLAQRIADGWPLTTPEEGRIRHQAVLRAGRILAWTLPTDTPPEVLRELIRPSVMGMPAFEGDGVRDGWCDGASVKVFESWQDGVKSRVTKEEKRVAENLATANRFKRMKEKINKRRTAKSGGVVALPVGPPSPPDEEVDEDEDGDAFDNWEEHLIYRRDKNGNEIFDKNGQRLIAGSERNAFQILMAHPEWHDEVLRYNEVTKTVDVTRGPLCDFENDPEQITTGIKYWLSKEYKVELRAHEVQAAILHAAKAASYNPLHDYLNSVSGYSNPDRFLEDYCGAIVVDGEGSDISTVVRRISRCFLIGAVARALDPGCKMDNVLIFEGEQGIKKSTMLDVLGGEWFADTAINIKDKDSKMLAARSWIVELPELSAMHASETEQQKAFFSSRIDSIRPPYGRSIVDFKRCCVFVGSTNDERYMNDITGNRRYWPVRCEGGFKIQKVRENRDAIWATAVAIYRAGGAACAKCVAAVDGEDRCHEHRWWLTPAENKLLEKMNNLRLRSDFSEAIIDSIVSIPLDERRISYTLFEVATRVLKLESDRVNGQQYAIGRALKALGFTNDRERQKNGHRFRVYYTPEWLLTQEKPKKETVKSRRDDALKATQPSLTVVQ